MYVNLQHLVGGINKYYICFQTELASPCVPAVATATMIARYFAVVVCLHVCSSS